MEREAKQKKLPPPCDGIERVSSLTALGVVINDQLTAADHVSSLLASCSRLLYALWVMRDHGIPAVRSVTLNLANFSEVAK